MGYVSEPGAVFGVDIGKAEVAVCRHGQDLVQCVTNTAAALTGWLRTVPTDALIVMEATNTYHEVLAGLAHGFGLQVVVLDPRRSWHYARAIDQRGKADRPDARMLARYGAHEWRKLPRWQSPTEGNVRLAKLLARRAALMRARVGLGQSLASLRELRAIRTHTEKALSRLIARLDLLILQEVARDAQLAALHRLLQTIVGVGPLVAAQLVQALSRLPWAHADAFIAYTGLDPRPDDSGTKRGRRRISRRGPPMLRYLLFMAAMAASKTRLCNPIYRALRRRGLASTEAFVILARRIARITFAIFRSGQPFDPTRLVTAPSA